MDLSTDAWQSGLFFSLGDFFFFPVLFSIGVACIREDLAEMCREQRRERERRLFCFSVLLA